MAETALLAGLPLEAKNIVDAAYKGGYFGKVRISPNISLYKTKRISKLPTMRNL